MDLLYKVRRELLRRNYSIRTIRTYLFCLKKFLFFVRKKEILKVRRYDIKRYMDYLRERKLSKSTMNVHLQAVKFAFEEILGRRTLFIKLPYAKVAKKFPGVLRREEIITLFSVVDNKVHKLIMYLMYSAGLRVSELVQLKVKDLEFENSIGWVRKGKGKKDRMFILAEKIKKDLQEHVEGKGSEEYVFPGRKGSHLSQRSVQTLLQLAAKKAKLGKKVHPHLLRHSFATHLIEGGYDLITVKSLLGHNSAQTTMVYVHIAKPRLLKVKSPLDSLEK